MCPEKQSLICSQTAFSIGNAVMTRIVKSVADTVQFPLLAFSLGGNG